MTTLKPFFERHPRWTLAAVVAVGFITLTVAVEIGLTLFFPFAVTNTGYVNTPNGERFGWGFAPGDLIRFEDPDSGQTWLERVNAKGWRDREHAEAKPPGVLRVVIVGDSNAFGFVVRAPDMFPRVLEDMLRADGYAVEVINISYPGWGTDQALEAVREEAVRYSPDIVIHHVAPNDPDDNIWHQDTGKFGARKPFYFELLDNGSVRRHANPRFAEERDAWTRKRIIAGSEILKRAWILGRAVKHAGRPRYAYGAGQLQRLRHFLAIDASHPFHRALEAIPGRQTDETTFSALVREHGLAGRVDVIARILDSVPFNHRGMPDLAGAPVDFSTYKWRLMFALIREMNRFLAAKGIRFAVSSDHDQGRYDWERAWYTIDGDAQSRDHFFAFDHALRAFCADSGISAVANRHPMARPKYDAHATAEGNRAMALNLREFLVSEYPRLLARHRR